MRCALEQLIRKHARLVGCFRAFPELRFQSRQILLAHLPLEEHLHREFAGFAS
jgi:hypothetical protein